MSDPELNGGDIITKVLRQHGLSYLFTLCGGHTAPILCGARKEHIRVVEGFGARGFLLDKTEDIGPALQQAKAAAREGHAVLINARIGRTDFRKGSISMQGYLVPKILSPASPRPGKM